MTLKVDTQPTLEMTNSTKADTDVPADQKPLQSMDEFIADAVELLKLFFSDQTAVAIEGAEKYASISLIHNLALNAISMVEVFMNMSKAQMKEAIVTTQALLTDIEPKRYVKSYKNMIMRPDYNTYTDEQCFAELAYAFSNLMIGGMIVLSDESVYGFVNGGYRINVAYRIFAECTDILNHRVKWESKIARDNFESLTLVGNGGFEMIISFFPSKLAKLLEYLGFNGNQHHAMQCLHRATELDNTVGYYVSSFILCAYYGFATCFYGIGEMNTAFIENTLNVWKSRVPEGSFYYIGLGILNMTKGRFTEAIQNLDLAISKQQFWPQMHFICWWSQSWCHSFMGQWKDAAAGMNKLRGKCKWAPSLFTCLYAMNLTLEYNEQKKLKFEDKDKQRQHNNMLQDLCADINDALETIPNLKKKLGGIHVFHEELSLMKHKKYHNNVDNWHLPIYELIYVWNFFYMMRNEPSLIKKVLHRIESYEQTLQFDEKTKSKSKNDVICYFKFIKATCHRHLKNEQESKRLFQEVLQFEGKLKSEKHLIPQTYYELGMIHRENGDQVGAKKHLKKVKSEYSGYFTETMFLYRIDMILEEYNRQKPKKI